MDQSTLPWRAFEAPDDDAAPQSSNGSQAPSPHAGGPPLGIVASIVGATTLLVIAAVVVAGGGSSTAAVEVDSSAGGSPERTTAATTSAVLIVDVAGAVVDPGVYRMPPDSRVADAIAIAGGYGPRVDARRVALELNLAAPLSDGQHLFVPSRDDPATSGGTGGGGPASGGVGSSAGSGSGTAALIDLNRATSAELDSLPGIGPVTAAKIISSRESAPFSKVEDLLGRKLVGQKTFDGLRELVTVR